MLCPCTVADDIYYIWLHFTEQRASHWSASPTHFLPSCALMIPWVWSSSVEVILFLVGCLLDPVNYKLLYWRCRNRNPYLLVVAVSSSPLWVSRQSFAVIFPKHSGYFLCFFLCVPFFLFSGASWFGPCVTIRCTGSYDACWLEEVRTKWGWRRGNFITRPKYQHFKQRLPLPSSAYAVPQVYLVLGRKKKEEGERERKEGKKKERNCNLLVYISLGWLSSEMETSAADAWKPVCSAHMEEWVAQGSHEHGGIQKKCVCL